MTPRSQQLREYPGPNPFHESQARSFYDDKVIEEFFPISLYWSLFNEQHEILLGTRGSGKTVILKMLSYCCLRRLQHDIAKRHVANKAFIGFYIPLHLEFMASLPGCEVAETERIRYFQFAVNCAACKALLLEVQCLLIDCFPDDRQRLVAESQIADHLIEMWKPFHNSGITSLCQLQRAIERLYYEENPSDPMLFDRVGVFAKTIFTPISCVLQTLTQDLGLDTQKTNWLACLDEAEFLSEPYIKCINTFLRSEKRPLVVKMATLPFKHSTRETLIPGVSIQPEGNDFDYRFVDTGGDSEDFKHLCNHLCRVRLAKCGITGDDTTLEQFLGVVNNDDLVDYYALELPDEASDDHIMEGIVKSLSPERQRHFEEIPRGSADIKHAYFKKFAPVYFVRRMRAENSRGNRTVGWFAGATTVRQIADGNPRRFIQIMKDMVEAARVQDLTPKNQHRVLMEYCERAQRSNEGLPELGLVVKEILDLIGSLLAARVHGKSMVNGGCGYSVEEALLEDTLVRRALELAIAYSLVVADSVTLTCRISRLSELRLSYLSAVLYWLPMRHGDVIVIKSPVTRLLRGNSITGEPFTPREAKTAVKQLKLEGIDVPDKESD